MTDLLEQVVRYLASKVGLTAGTNIFYNEMPDELDKCVLVQEVPTNETVLPQIDAEVHRLRIVVRDVSYTTALTLTELCWRWLLTDIQNYDLDKREDANGFITLLNGVKVMVTLYGNPVWYNTDQQRRKYYNFYATVITKR